MKKIFIIFVSLIFFQSPVLSDEVILQGSVAYTVDSARKQAFDGILLKLDKTLLKPHLLDENNKENKEAIKNNIQPKGRYIMSFSMLKDLIKGYVVVYEKMPQYAYYYTSGGTLVCVDFDNKSQEGVFPYTVGKYSALTGNLIAIGFYVSDDEQYAYTKNGKLKAHWVKDTAYNEKGKPIAKRNIVDEIFDH